MRDILWCLNEAKKHSGLKSDRALDRALGMKAQMVIAYRDGTRTPSDATMVELARLAGVPAEQALVDLAIIRTTGSAQHYWKGIAQKLNQGDVGKQILAA